MRYAIVLIILTMIACTQSEKTSDITERGTFAFAVMEGKPIFEDEYMFDKVDKNYLQKEIDGRKIYLIDWDGNKSYSDVGVDYIGVKMKGEYRPTIELIGKINTLNINGQTYELSQEENGMTLSQLEVAKRTHLNTLDSYFPIELTSGEHLQPAFDTDTTIIYFWATWCRPCVETLKNITPKLDELAADNITLIPIAHDCSNCEEFLEKNGMPYEYRHITKTAARQVNIQSLAKQLTFLADQSLTDDTHLSRYYR